MYVQRCVEHTVQTYCIIITSIDKALLLILNTITVNVVLQFSEQHLDCLNVRLASIKLQC